MKEYADDIIKRIDEKHWDAASREHFGKTEIARTALGYRDKVNGSQCSSQASGPKG